MRNFLLVMLTFISVHVFAQKECSVVFDFTRPLELTPAITPSDVKGGSEVTTNVVFKEGQINMSFLAGPKPTGSRIVTEIAGDNKYHLELGVSTTTTFSAIAGASINRIEISENSIIGGFHLLNNQQPGEMETSKIWRNNADEEVKEVKFYNNGTVSEFQQVTVYYTTPSDILIPVSSINDNDVVPSFKEMTLTFTSSMKVLDASKIEIKGENLTEKVNATVSDNIVTLSLDTPIEKDGVYTVTIPARSFESVDGYQNKELKYVFTVKTPKNTFAYTTVNPELGKVDHVTDNIVVAFPGIIGHVENLSLQLCRDGEQILPMSMEKNPADNKSVILKFKNDIQEVYTEKGEYTIKVPEKTIYNAFYGETEGELYNPEFILTYKIGIDDPEPPTPSEDTETMKAAKALLLNVGVGFPTENSVARVSLQELVSAEKTPSDDELKAAMSVFYAEKDITLPVTDKFYTISSVNSVGDSLYLAYGNGKVTLSDDVKNAARFVATANADGSVTFKTVDGKYLHILTAAQNYDQTTSDNVSGEYNAAVNNLKLSKLEVNGVDQKKLLGNMTLFGCLGKDVDTGKEVSAFAVVRHVNATIATDATKYAEPLFTDNLSSAFVVTEVEPENLEVVELEANLTPAVVAYNTEKLSLKFTSDVVLSDASAAYFNNEKGEKVGVAIITSIEGNNKEFAVSLTGLTDGTYTLVIPEMMFATEKDGKKAWVKGFEKNFTIDISEAEHFMTNFYFSIYKDKTGDYCFDTDLNDFVIYSYSPMYADGEKEVKLYNAWSILDVIRVGHLQKVTLDDLPDAYAYKLIFDKPIEEGELKPNQYTIVLEEGVVGDIKFGMYLNDRNSVKKSECNVNPRMTFQYDVNNDNATGISDVAANEDDETVIYTISGRRVKEMNTSGIYIVNGKKVIR